MLHVADCPGTATLLGRLSVLTGAEVETRPVGDEETAKALGMAGSPTMLVDGVDPFADGTAPSLACRLYRDERGTVSGSPSVTQLIEVLHGGGRIAGTSARAHRLTDELRASHRLILREFLATGRPPDHGISAADLLRLSTEDLIQLDGDRVAVAYPFSGQPTAHRVRLTGGPAVWAMCAIDALGIPRMARRDGVIESGDPVTGAPIRVSVSAGVYRWEPAGTVVLVARSPGGGPTSCCACPHMNFHESPESARSYLDEHGALSGQILDQRTAVDLAELCFGSLLEV